MFGIVNFGAFLLSSVLLNITPGADTVYILGRSISGGRKNGVVSALGISTGVLVHTTLAAFGLSVVLAQSAAAFNLVKWAGAAYLVWMGIRALFSRGTAMEKGGQPGTDDGTRTYFQGVLTNVLNPKVALFFLAFLPQFVAPEHSAGPLPFLLLGLTFFCTSTVWCVIVACGSSAAALLLTRKQGMSALFGRLAGILYIGLGLNLLRAKLASSAF